MKENIILKKTYDFALQIIELYKYLNYLDNSLAVIFFSRPLGRGLQNQYSEGYSH